jgi:transposase
VLKVAGEVDLSGFMAGYRADGQGAAGYHPEMMVALVLYCYGKGIRSSRGIEAACLDDVGCRVITANHRVDHSTVARFTHRHRRAIKDLFVQVIGLCAEQGLIDPAAVAIDGSPIGANAAKSANRTLERLEADIAECEAGIAALMWEVFVCARLCEDGGGLEPPPERRGGTAPARLSRLTGRLLRARSARDKLYERALSSPGERSERLAAAQRMAGRAERALAGAVAEQQDRLDAYAERAARDRAAGLHGAVGRPPAALADKTEVRFQRARLARTLTWLERARNPRAAPSCFARACLTDPDSRLLPGKQGGYLQGYNLQIACARGQVLTAIELHDNPADMTALAPMVARTRDNRAAAGISGDVGAWLADAGYACTANFDALAAMPMVVAVAKERDQTGRTDPEAGKSVPPGWQRMSALLSTPAGHDLYRRRGALVEPGFAQLFQRFGRYLNYRGTDAADTEIKLLGTVHNLAKLFRARGTNTRPAAPGPPATTRQPATLTPTPP